MELNEHRTTGDVSGLEKDARHLEQLLPELDKWPAELRAFMEEIVRDPKAWKQYCAENGHHGPMNPDLIHELLTPLLRLQRLMGLCYDTRARIKRQLDR